MLWILKLRTSKFRKKYRINFLARIYAIFIIIRVSWCDDFDEVLSYRVRCRSSRCCQPPSPLLYRPVRADLLLSSSRHSRPAETQGFILFLTLNTRIYFNYVIVAFSSWHVHLWRHSSAIRYLHLAHSSYDYHLDGESQYSIDSRLGIIPKLKKNDQNETLPIFPVYSR